MGGVATKAIGWTETGHVPDAVIRSMRPLLEQKRVEIGVGEIEFAARTIDAQLAEDLE